MLQGNSHKEQSKVEQRRRRSQLEEQVEQTLESAMEQQQHLQQVESHPQEQAEAGMHTQPLPSGGHMIIRDGFTNV